MFREMGKSFKKQGNILKRRTVLLYTALLQKLGMFRDAADEKLPVEKYSEIDH
jgi:hypothetical protein